MKALLSSLLLVCSWWVNAADTLTMSVDPSNTQFKVSLPANATTGYKWTVKQYDQTLLNLTGSQYIAPQKKLIGAGGQMVFTFELIKGKSYPKSTQMLFSYERPWDAKSGKPKTVIVNFTSLKNKVRVDKAPMF